MMGELYPLHESNCLIVLKNKVRIKGVRIMIKVGKNLNSNSKLKNCEDSNIKRSMKRMLEKFILQIMFCICFCCFCRKCTYSKRFFCGNNKLGRICS